MARDQEDWVPWGPCGNQNVHMPYYRVKNINLNTKPLVKNPPQKQEPQINQGDTKGVPNRLS